MKNIILLIAITFLSNFDLCAQQAINPENIDIVRDKFSVPHIFTKTDAEATYGIAWAQCEDNFPEMQKNFGMTKNMAGRLIGKNGAVVDYLYQMFEVDQFVESRYKLEINQEMEVLLNAYTSSVNKYAKENPKEVKINGLFPITPKLEVIKT